MSVDSGKFITLEGGEGVGKTTNAPFIKDYLHSRDIPVLVTREPGGTVLAEKIRELLLNSGSEQLTCQTELLLMFAARAQHFQHVILPALERGQWVLCDRFTDATYAYQGGGRGLPVADIQWLENFVQGDLRPNLTLLLDAPVEKGMGRVKSRGDKPDRFESERLHFFSRVRDFYLEQARQFPERIRVINADQTLTEVQQHIAKELDSLIICR